MSINVYLKDGWEKAEGVTVKPGKERDGTMYETHHIQGMYIFKDRGRRYFSLSDFTDHVPDTIKEFVEDFSFHGEIATYPKRTIGVYEHQDATAELDRRNEGTKHEAQFLKIRSKSIETMHALYRMVRAGTLIPTESWEADQQTLPAVVPPGPAEEQGDPPARFPEPSDN